MITIDFIHLRLHTEFSISDGIVRINEAVEKTHEWGMPALGISDLMNLFGAVKFYQACQEKGIKPIISADIWLQNDKERDQPHRLLLMVKNHNGYQRLCTLLTEAYLHNQYQERAEIKADWLKEGDNSGLICLSGANHGDIAWLLRNGHIDEAIARAQHWETLFPQSFYLEIQRLNEASEELVQSTLWIANQTKLPVVATHPIQFMQPEDFKAHEARVCIAEGYTLDDKRRPKRFEPSQYFVSAKAMQERFADIPAALQNSVEIAKRCNLTLSLGKNYLPKFAIPSDTTIDEYLVKKTQEGLSKRLIHLYPDPKKREQQQPLFEERLAFETDTIIQMGFSGYFLIVSDLINWAKNNGCPVGPGRGSGVGCLVSYSLGITEINPLDYGLLFERFLNPERMSTPDLDIDFCQENRHRVIEHVRDHYGKEAVSQIATFGKLTSKAVIRDVGRAMALPYTFCDQLAKLIPFATNKQYTLDEAVEHEPILKERLKNEEETAELWALAKKLEGLTRNASMHAGGVLIAPSKLTDFCPIYQGSGHDAVPVSMYDKNDIEKIGLVKFDFLGLRNLTIIDLTFRYIQSLDPTFKMDLNGLSLTDSATYQTLQKANTTAVFQLESEGMKRLLERIKPDHFEDIVSVLALYRPGPLGSGMIDDFILRKKGTQKINYFHPDLEACLKPTYGVILYQEQVMKISQIIGGYTLAGADTLCKIMSKKKTEEMDKHRLIFIDGAKKKNYSPRLAEQLFDLMAKFAEYGFNKSHSTAYAVLAYQTAWLKTHHCAAFISATMSCELNNTDQLKIFYDDARRNKLTFLPLDINESFYHFKPIDHQQIRYGLGAIKGVGETAVEEIIREREARGPFTSFFDFCQRTERQHINKRAIEALVCAGAFDWVDTNRAKLFKNIELGMAFGEHERASSNQGKLFSDHATHPISSVHMIECEPWSLITQLTNEKNVLGFYFSGHPFDLYANDAKHFTTTPLWSINKQKRDQTWLAGIAAHIRTKFSSQGKMAFIRLEDLNATIEVVVYAETFDKCRAKIQEDSPLVINAKISHDDFSDGLRIIAEDILTIGEARGYFADCLQLEVNGMSDLTSLKEMLSDNCTTQYGTPVQIIYQNGQAVGQYRFAEHWKVQLNDDLLASLRLLLGDEAVHVIWKTMTH